MKDLQFLQTSQALAWCKHSSLILAIQWEKQSQLSTCDLKQEKNLVKYPPRNDRAERIRIRGRHQLPIFFM